MIVNRRENELFIKVRNRLGEGSQPSKVLGSQVLLLFIGMKHGLVK